MILNPSENFPIHTGAANQQSVPMRTDLRFAQEWPLPILPGNFQQPVKLLHPRLILHKKMNQASVLQNSFQAIENLEIKRFRLRFPAQALYGLRRLPKSLYILKVCNRQRPESTFPGDIDPILRRKDAVHTAIICVSAQLLACFP